VNSDFITEREEDLSEIILNSTKRKPTLKLFRPFAHFTPSPSEGVVNTVVLAAGLRNLNYRGHREHRELWFKINEIIAPGGAFATPSPPGEGRGEEEIQKLRLCRVAV